MPINKKSLLLFLLALCLVPGGCSVVQFARLAKCEFEMDRVADVTWADINMSNVNGLSDLSVTNMTKAVKAIKNKDFNVYCKVMVKVKNNTKNTARLIGYDYELYLEDKFLAKGSSHNVEYYIDPSKTATIPIPVQVNIADVVKKKEVGDIIRCVKNLNGSGNGKESNVAVKFTPYLYVGKKQMKLPAVTLHQTISSEKSD